MPRRVRFVSISAWERRESGALQRRALAFLDSVCIGEVQGDYSGETIVDHSGRQWWPGEFEPQRGTRSFRDRKEMAAFVVAHAADFLEDARRNDVKPSTPAQLRRTAADRRAERHEPAEGFTSREPIHDWFGLSYSNYLVVPRSIAQSMPPAWQRQLVDLLEQAQRRLDIDDAPSNYLVRARVGGKFIADPYRDYERGRRRVPVRKRVGR